MVGVSGISWGSGRHMCWLVLGKPDAGHFFNSSSSLKSWEYPSSIPDPTIKICLDHEQVPVRKHKVVQNLDMITGHLVHGMETARKHGRNECCGLFRLLKNNRVFLLFFTLFIICCCCQGENTTIVSWTDLYFADAKLNWNYTSISECGRNLFRSHFLLHWIKNISKVPWNHNGIPVQAAAFILSVMLEVQCSPPKMAHRTLSVMGRGYLGLYAGTGGDEG
jgi:hypothetical protein